MCHFEQNGALIAHVLLIIIINDAVRTVCNLHYSDVLGDDQVSSLTSPHNVRSIDLRT